MLVLKIKWVRSYQLLSLFMVINPGEDVKPTEPEQKFEVVDNYKECDVVRYTPDNSARYSYFLDCKK